MLSRKMAKQTEV